MTKWFGVDVDPTDETQIRISGECEYLWENMEPVDLIEMFDCADLDKLDELHELVKAEKLNEAEIGKAFLRIILTSIEAVAAIEVDKGKR